MKAILLFVSALVLATSVSGAVTSRDLLVSKVKGASIESMFAKADKAVFIPPYADRAKWNAIPDSIRREIIKQGEVALSCNWATVKATDFLAFKWTGDRSAMEKPHNDRRESLRTLVFAELVEGKGRFIPQIINGVWAICEQSSWVLSAHLPIQKKWTGLPDDQDIIIDLGSGEVGALLSWTYTLFHDEFDKVSPLINRKIKSTVRERILVPYYTREDMWWMGFDPKNLINNWNVWVNYNVLQCIWLMEEDVAVKAKGVFKTMRSVDKFINAYPGDGGCDEGPSYWSHAGAKLYEYLYFIKQISSGSVDLFSEPIVKNIASYILKVNVAYPYVVNFGDASANLSVSPSLVYRFGKAVDDKSMVSFGSFLAHRLNEYYYGSSFISSVQDLFEREQILKSAGQEPLLANFWFSNLQLGGARDFEGSSRGFYFAAMGANNEQSHNHNDVGSFVLYYDGKPLLADAGVGTYTRQTFSSERYSIWTMQSSFHNLPDINGCAQSDGRKYAASNVQFSSGKKVTSLSMDIVHAYSDSCGVKSWVRSYSLNKGKNFVVEDKFEIQKVKGKSILNFITPAQVVKARGCITLKNGDEEFSMNYNPALFEEVVIESIPFDDPRLTKVWTKGLNRIRLTYKETIQKTESSIIVKKVH